MEKPANAPAQKRMSNEDFWKFITLILGAFAAIAGWLAWNAARTASRERGEKLEKYKQEAALEIALANQRAAQAGVDAARAIAEAAKANLELEKIKERYRHRAITQEQRAKILAAVASAPKGAVIVQASTDGEDTKGFADSLREMLREAGYDTESLKIGPFMNLDGPQPYDIEVVVKDVTKAPVFAGALINALIAETGFVIAVHQSLELNPQVTYENMFLRVQPKPSAK